MVLFAVGVSNYEQKFFRHYQLLSEDEFKSVLDACRRRFEVSLEKRKSEEEEEEDLSEESEGVFPHQDWVIFHDKRAPFDTSASKVPPLRYAFVQPAGKILNHG